MKKKRIIKQDYETFLNELECRLQRIKEKYNDSRKDDVYRFESKYLTGWDDGAILICELVLNKIKKFK